MKEELEQELYKKYPGLFRQRALPMSETCLCWGVCFGSGWYNILETVCEELKSIPGLEFTQLKEKFGSMRIYTNFTNDKVEAAINKAVKASLVTCETCGKPAKINKGPWLRVECKACKKIRETKK